VIVRSWAQARVAERCAARLGLDDVTARHLLEVAERRTGPRRYWLRAAAFAVVLQPWVEAVAPASLRRRAVAAFAGAVLDSPAARNVYAAERWALLADPSAGLLRRS
jgi:hypothetical protein